MEIPECRGMVVFNIWPSGGHSRMSWYGCVQWFEVSGGHSRMSWYGCVQWFEVSGWHSITNPSISMCI